MAARGYMAQPIPLPHKLVKHMTARERSERAHVVRNYKREIINDAPEPIQHAYGLLTDSGFTVGIKRIGHRRYANEEDRRKGRNEAARKRREKKRTAAGKMEELFI